jgi:septation ring formation regulator EzrA
MKQLMLFDLEEDPKKEMEVIKDEWERTRKSLYAKNAALTKTVQEINHELQWIKLHLCKGRLTL